MAWLQFLQAVAQMNFECGIFKTFNIALYLNSYNTC